MKQEAHKDAHTYRKTARILVLFVAAYLAQWWPSLVYVVWSFFGTPHVAITMVCLSLIFIFLSHYSPKKVSE